MQFHLLFATLAKTPSKKSSKSLFLATFTAFLNFHNNDGWLATMFQVQWFEMLITHFSSVQCAILVKSFNTLKMMSKSLFLATFILCIFASKMIGLQINVKYERLIC